MLDILLKDMYKQNILYQPTTFWKEASKIIIDELKKDKISKFRSFDSSTSMFAPLYSFPHYSKDDKYFTPLQKLLVTLTDDAKSKLKLDLLIKGHTQAFADYRVLCAGNVNKVPYTDRVSESTIGEPLEHFQFNGRNFSRSFLNYLLGLNFLKQNVDTLNIKTVLEIGGGFGSLGEILLGDERNDIFYINVDIPPVGYISSYYLRELYGDKSADYNDLKMEKTLHIQTLKQKYRALSLASWQIEKLKGKIDLFVNFISFQEMEPEIVKNYCDHIQRLNPEYILLRNIQEGKRKQDDNCLFGVKEPIKGENYDAFLPNYELVATDESIFGLKMEDNFHSQLRIYKRKGI